MPRRNRRQPRNDCKRETIGSREPPSPRGCGRIVNPTIVEGQIHGGVPQGIGGALYVDTLALLTIFSADDVIRRGDERRRR